MIFLRLKDEPLGPNPSARKLRQKRQTTSSPSAFGSPSKVGRLSLQFCCRGRRRYQPQKAKVWVRLAGRRQSIRESSEVLQQAPLRTQAGLITARLCGSTPSLRPLFVFQAPPKKMLAWLVSSEVTEDRREQRSLFPSQEVPITEEVEGGRTGLSDTSGCSLCPKLMLRRSLEGSWGLKLTLERRASIGHTHCLRIRKWMF